MIDANFILKNEELVRASLKSRNSNFDLDDLLVNINLKNNYQKKLEDLFYERNSIAKEVSIFKNKGQSYIELLDKANLNNNNIRDIEKVSKEFREKVENLLLHVPNIPHESVVHGMDHNSNVLIREHGQPRQFDFKPLEHGELGEKNKIIDFEVAANMSGARFAVLERDLSRLNRAVISFMLDSHTMNHGYTEVSVPYLVKKEALIGTGQLPKFSEDLFYIEKDGLYLIPTAEVPITNLFRNRVLKLDELPIKMVAHTPCFRREAGSYGKDTKGMIRQHQFDKVELVNISHPSNSYDNLETLTNSAENILKELDLPYRVVSLCSGDLGFGAAKTFDIEVFLPSQNMYREISSCSNFEGFQAKRLNIKVKDGKKNILAHTINGSGLAVGRTLVAILENYQNMDYSIEIPKVLRPYMNNQSTISVEKISGRKYTFVS